MVYARSDKDVLCSEEEEWLHTLHKEERFTRERYYIKTASEEIWNCKSQPGNVVLMVPLDADEYNDVTIYSIFLYCISCSIEKWMLVVGRSPEFLVVWYVVLCKH